MNNTKTISILRTITGVAALAVFVILFLNHKMQMWLIIFAASAILSTLLGRFYCSWICPMHTIFRPIGWLYTKLKIKRFKTPKFIKNGALRIIILVLVIALMVLTKKIGLKINAILYITLFSVILTLFFEENMWHRHLCPFGTILSLTSRKSKYRLEISEDACISCGKCQRVCPSQSIITLENKKRKNIKHECLLCGKCIPVCPESVCNFTF